MFETHRRRRRERRVRPGDDSALRDYRFWQLFHRSLFVLDLPEADGAMHRMTVDVHHLADDLSLDDSTSDSDEMPPVALYRDGVQVARANPPAAFPVAGGHLEVARNLYGMTRMHYVPVEGPARALTPHPRTLEGWRARFGRRFPAASRAIGAIAVVVLLVGLVVAVPQLVELVTHLELVADHVDPFTSPLSLPAWANGALLVAGALAATERALTLRNHWLIDADTTWTGLA
ncbi:hypothetical protein [Brachybacterium sp. YJGR34]|uniref:hypothetical protein n=1 Tax=Brachybacterium sp. YJGR34 TaxID=2059911 RepID=UPI000E0C35B4|nr:hypothetical protein [Brachybacterium sp. YJGR34]